MARRFITRRDIEEAIASGTCEIEVDDEVTVTDLAREHALARGVRFVRASNAPAAPASGQGSGDGPDLRGRVRAAVVARLGAEPDGLDAIIDSVLARTAARG
jgi:hypothetical protein